jgi:hypothetical protein
MAFLIEEKRCTAPTSSVQVNAVIGLTAGMVINRSTRSISGSACDVVGNGSVQADACDRQRQNRKPDAQLRECDLLADRLIDVRYLCFHFRYRNRRIDATYDFANGLA